MYWGYNKLIHIIVYCANWTFAKVKNKMPLSLPQFRNKPSEDANNQRFSPREV